MLYKIQIVTTEIVTIERNTWQEAEQVRQRYEREAAMCQGHHGEQTVVKFIEPDTEFFDIVQRYITQSPAHARRLAAEYEVPVSILERWAKGACYPHPFIADNVKRWAGNRLLHLQRLVTVPGGSAERSAKLLATMPLEEQERRCPWQYAFVYSRMLGSSDAAYRRFKLWDVPGLARAGVAKLSCVDSVSQWFDALYEHPWARYRGRDILDAPQRDPDPVYGFCIIDPMTMACVATDCVTDHATL